MPEELDPKKIDALRTEVAVEAAEKASKDITAKLLKSMGLPDDYKLGEKDQDSLFKSAGIPTKDEVVATVIDQLKASESKQLIGDIADSRREKSSSGFPRPPFSFIDVLRAVAAADPRTHRKSLPKLRTTAEEIATWGRENEKERYENLQEQGKALDLSSGAAGGFLVPEFYSDMLLQPKPGAAPCLPLGTNVPMGDMRVLHFPRLAALFNPDIYWEEYMPGTAKTATDTPEFERPDLTLQNYYVLWQITHDLLKFNNVGIEQLMIGWVGAGIQRELDRLMVVGSTVGGDPYNGVLNTAGVTGLALLVPGTLGWADLRNIRASVPAQYHPNCRYVMNQAAESACMQLTDAFGNPLWNRDMTGTRPNLIDGWPYIVDNQIPSNIGGANQSVIFFGDFSYWLQGNGGQEFGVSDHVGFKENQTWYKIVGYADGFYAITEAMAYLTAVPV